MELPVNPISIKPAYACSLDKLADGARGIVCSVETPNIELKRRLLEMGFCTRTEVRVIRRAPFGDPIEIQLREYCLFLRKEQAECVVIEPLTVSSVPAPHKA